MFAIGSLLDGYRDAAVQIYEHLDSKGVPCKLAISPSTHTLPDVASPGPLWDWREEAVMWFKHFLLDETTTSTTTTSTTATADSNNRVKYDVTTENKVAVYLREGGGNDSIRVDGQWVNLENGPTIPRDNALKYFLTSDHTLTALLPQDPQEKHSLAYDPAVGTEMGTWWGEASLGDMAALDAESLIYDLPIVDEALVLIGQTEVYWDASVMFDDVDSGSFNWFVRLEDVFSDGTVRHVTGASINAAQAQGNGTLPLTSDRSYSFSIKLHYSTWTFHKGHVLRIAFTNAMFPMAWPSPHKFTSSVLINSENTFVLLPLAPRAKEAYPLHDYDRQRLSKHAEPSDGWYFSEGGYPYENTVETVNGMKIVTWKSDYYMNCYGWIISVELDYEWQQSLFIPSATTWSGYARQIYQYVGTTDKGLWEESENGDPSLLHPTPLVPPIQREFALETNLTIWSDSEFFYAVISRTMKNAATGENLVNPYSNKIQIVRTLQ